MQFPLETFKSCPDVFASQASRQGKGSSWRSPQWLLQLQEAELPRARSCLIYEVSRPLARRDLMHRSTEYLEELSHLLPHGVSVRRINDFPKLNSTSGLVYKKEKGEERANLFFFCPSTFIHTGVYVSWNRRKRAGRIMGVTFHKAWFSHCVLHEHQF